MDAIVDGLELTAVVASLREQLTQAREQAQRQGVLFQVDKIEVEFQTVVQKEGSSTVGAKMKFWVLDAEASLGGKYSHAATHKIKLSLSPIDTGAESAQAAESAKHTGAVRISGNVQRVQKE